MHVGAGVRVGLQGEGRTCHSNPDPVVWAGEKAVLMFFFIPEAECWMSSFVNAHSLFSFPLSSLCSCYLWEFCVFTGSQVLQIDFPFFSAPISLSIVASWVNRHA